LKNSKALRGACLRAGVGSGIDIACVTKFERCCGSDDRSGPDVKDPKDVRLGWHEAQVQPIDKDVFKHESGFGDLFRAVVSMQQALDLRPTSRNRLRLKVTSDSYQVEQHVAFSQSGRGQTTGICQNKTNMRPKSTSSQGPFRSADKEMYRDWHQVVLLDARKKLKFPSKESSKS
jgi:hypothetical protein